MDISGKKVWIVGLGKSGRSLLDTARRLGARCQAADTRLLADADALRSRYPDVDFHFGAFRPGQFSGADAVLVSPGLAWDIPALRQAREQGVPILGDMELFGRLAHAPIVAITGSNGKSTVTTLVGEMAKAAGWRVAVGGNLGTPALELLPSNGPEPELYVLELSSFQLAACTQFHPRAAAILNFSPDHLDWHGDYAAYRAAKARIFQAMGTGDTLVLNAGDAAVMALVPTVPAGVRIVTFAASDAHTPGSVMERDGYFWRLDEGASERLMAVTQLRLMGAHNRENAMAALALGSAVGLPAAAMAQALATFAGLPHRMSRVGQVAGVDYYDDSKGTNLGATLKAIAGLPGPLVLILGGDAKGADLSPLRAACAGQRAAVLLGKDAPLLAEVLAGVLPLRRVRSMEEAVRAAAAVARPGDQVLLSPACASLDMFADYQDRGRQFQQAVRNLAGGEG
ncbi:UDP-N-acetylmuramoyl-L-alanine--D-glutamate ligase [Acidithiobacillus sulfuriphilus]